MRTSPASQTRKIARQTSRIATLTDVERLTLSDRADGIRVVCDGVGEAASLDGFHKGSRIDSLRACPIHRLLLAMQRTIVTAVPVGGTVTSEVVRMIVPSFRSAELVRGGRAFTAGRSRADNPTRATRGVLGYASNDPGKDWRAKLLVQASGSTRSQLANWPFDVFFLTTIDFSFPHRQHRFRSNSTPFS